MLSEVTVHFTWLVDQSDTVGSSGHSGLSLVSIGLDCKKHQSDDLSMRTVKFASA